MYIVRKILEGGMKEKKKRIINYFCLQTSACVKNDRKRSISSEEEIFKVEKMCPNFGAILANLCYRICVINENLSWILN